MRTRINQLVVFSLWMLVFSQVYLHASAINRHVVTCDVQRKACECNHDADECEFTFVIEQLQTFTSYKIENADPTYSSNDIQGGSASFLEEDGTPYYINGTGQLRATLEFKNDPEISCITGSEDFAGKSCTVPQTVDGKTYRPFLTVNGLVPGPTVIVNEGQIVIVNVVNRLLSESTSLHWHGMDMYNTPWMDGALLISQCPIEPGETFRYYFQPSPTGTYWYHSHRITQRLDGLFGGLVIKEKSSRQRNLEQTLGATIIDKPGDFTLNLHEWKRETAVNKATMIKGGLPFFPDSSLGEVPLPPSEQMAAMNVSQPYLPFDRSVGPDGIEVGDIPFWSGLINGKGRHQSVPYEKSRLSVFTVDEGKSYRFRLIGAQSLFAYKFSIDEHNLTVISTDGSLIEPIETQFIIIHIGERYDFILKARKPREEIQDYWIRAETLEVDVNTGLPYRSLGHIAEGILHYNGSFNKSNPKTDPDQIPSSVDYENIKRNSIPFDANTCGSRGGCTAVNCPFPSFHRSYNIPTCINPHMYRMLEPTDARDVPNANVDPSCTDCELFFNINSDHDAINGRNMRLPPAPLQTQRDDIIPTEFCGADVRTCRSNQPCQCIHVREIQSFNKTIRFVFSSVGNEVNEGEGFSHPIHLHGHHFFVVGVGYGVYDPSNGFLTNRIGDVACDDPLCTSPRWESSTRPEFTIDSKTVRKDTIIVPAGGYVVVQFISNNPGYWFMHCHIESDLLEGMAVAINIAEKRHNPPPIDTKTCGDFYITNETFYKRLAYDPDGGVQNRAGLALVLFSVVFCFVLLLF